MAAEAAKTKSSKGSAVLALIQNSMAAKPTAQPSAMTEQQQAKLLHYAEITGQDLVMSAPILRSHSWNVERAVAAFFDPPQDHDNMATDANTSQFEKVAKPATKQEIERECRLLKFLRFSLAVSYGLDQDSEDKLSKDEWRFFVGMSITMARHLFTGPDDSPPCKADMEVIVRYVDVPAKSLGLNEVSARFALIWFGYSMTDLWFDAGGINPYRSLDLEVEEELGWMVHAVCLGYILSADQRLLIQQVYPTDTPFRRRIYEAHEEVKNKYFEVFTENPNTRVLTTFGKICNSGVLKHDRCHRPPICGCAERRDRQKLLRFKQLYDLARLLNLEEHEVQEDDMDKWRSAKHKEEGLYVIPSVKRNFLVLRPKRKNPEPHVATSHPTVRSKDVELEIEDEFAELYVTDESKDAEREIEDEFAELYE